MLFKGINWRGALGCLALLLSSTLHAAPAPKVDTDILERYRAELARLSVEFHPDRLIRDSLLNANNALYYYKFGDPLKIKSTELESWMKPVLEWPEKIHGVDPGEFFRNPYFLQSVNIQTMWGFTPPREIKDVRWVLANETALKSEGQPEYALNAAFMHVKFSAPGKVKDATIFLKMADGWHMVDLLAKRNLLTLLPESERKHMNQSSNPENCMQCHNLKKHSDFITIKSINSYVMDEFVSGLKLKKVPVKSLSDNEFSPKLLGLLRKSGERNVCFSDSAIDTFGIDERLIAKYREVCNKKFGKIAMALSGTNRTLIWRKNQSFMDE